MSREEESFEAGESGAAESPARPFAPGEMVACGECLRANAPTRMNCLYCGAPLPVTEQSTRLRRPSLRALEEWEPGFNVILQPRDAAPAPGALEEAASLLRMRAELLGECLAAGRALPLARAASREEAGLVVERLAALGLAAETLSDEELGMGTRQWRVRALEFGEEGPFGVGLPGEEPRGWRWSEVGLLLTGRVVRKRVEVEERHEKSKREGEVVDTRELSEDEAVLDLYAAGGGAVGWRVLADNFDYSCLGADKSLLARENFVRLVALLRGRAPGAVYDDAYASSRRLLAAAWPPGAREDTLGFRRERVGRYSTGALTVVSNEAQFTRYSRLRWHLARIERDLNRRSAQLPGQTLLGQGRRRPAGRARGPRSPRRAHAARVAGRAGRARLRGGGAQAAARRGRSRGVAPAFRRAARGAAPEARRPTARSPGLAPAGRGLAPASRRGEAYG